MIQTRREIVDELLDFSGELNDATARATAERLIVRVVQTLWSRHPWTVFQAPTQYSFASVSGTRSYALPVYFGRPQPKGVGRNLTTGEQVYWREQADLLEDDPTIGTTLETAGRPYAYYVAGTAGVAVQPASTGEAVEIVSSSASDTTVVVTIEGMDANGVEQRAQYTLNGTTPVSAGTWSYIEECSKAMPAGTYETNIQTSSVGTMTLRKAGVGATLESLLPDESARSHTLLNLYHVPNGVWTFAFPYIRAPRRLIYDSDQLPDGWGPMVLEEMRLEWYLNRGELNAGAFASAPRPAFLDALCEDNRTRKRPVTKPYHRP